MDRFSKTNRGFTLIELMIVVTIIGILSAIVLSALNNARSKGGDGAIKSTIANARSQAELFYNTNGTLQYQNLCIAGNASQDSRVTSAFPMLQGATNAGSTEVSCGVTSGGGSWAIAARLKNVANTWYCVDSLNKGKVVTSATTPITNSATAATDVSCD